MFLFGWLRNLPQIVIQILYAREKQSVDIIVLNAMLFSIFSALISVFAEMSRFVKRSQKKSLSSSQGRITECHQLTIECDKLKPVHCYTKQRMHQIIDQLLITNGMFNASDTVEIFYIVHIRNKLMYFIDIDSKSIVETFSLLLNDPGSKMSTMMKQDLMDILGLDSSDVSISTINVSFIPSVLTSTGINGTTQDTTSTDILTANSLNCNSAKGSIATIKSEDIINDRHSTYSNSSIKQQIMLQAMYGVHVNNDNGAASQDIDEAEGSPIDIYLAKSLPNIPLVVLFEQKRFPMATL